MSFSKFYQRFKTRCTGFYYDTVRDDATSSYFEIIRSQITSIKIINFECTDKENSFIILWRLFLNEGSVRVIKHICSS